MPFEDDPEHVVHFALQPVGRGPDALHAGHRLVLADVRLHAQPLILLERIEVQHQVESLLALGPIHRRQIAQPVELFFVAAVDARSPAVARRATTRMACLRSSPGFANRVAESLLVPLHQIIIERDRTFFRRGGGGLGWRCGCSRLGGTAAAGLRQAELEAQPVWPTAGGVAPVQASLPRGFSPWGGTGGCFSSGSLVMSSGDDWRTRQAPAAQIQTVRF